MSDEEKVENTPVKEEKKNDFVIPMTEEEKQGDETKILPPNSKPLWFMRIAAGLIDLFLLFLASFALVQVFRNTAMNKPLKQYENYIYEVQEEYKLVSLNDNGDTYGYKCYSDEPAYEENVKNHIVHSDTEVGKQYIILDYEDLSDELKKTYVAKVKADDRYKDYSFYYRLIDSGYTCLAGFISCSVFLLAIPLLNKRRATVGKLLAGTMLINSKYETEAKWYQIVGRFFFQYFVEGVLPFLLLTNGLWVALVVPIILFSITLFNKNRRTLHDFATRTRVIDARAFKRLAEH